MMRTFFEEVLRNYAKSFEEALKKLTRNINLGGKIHHET